MNDDSADIYANIAQGLATCLPDRWSKSVVRATVVEGRLHLCAHYHDDGIGSAPHPITDFGRAALFVRLREAMTSNTPWRSATFTLFPNGLFDCVFDYASEAEYA